MTTSNVESFEALTYRINSTIWRIDFYTEYARMLLAVFAHAKQNTNNFEEHGALLKFSSTDNHTIIRKVH